MDRSLARQLLVNQYHSYLKVCQERGLSYEVPDDDVVGKLNDTDLAAIVRQLKDLARTPGLQ